MIKEKEQFERVEMEVICFAGTDVFTITDSNEGPED